MSRRTADVAVLALVLAWCAAMLHRGEPLAWDEIEFFRATRWIAEGRLPFRDYWEHHLPLQWFLFAPVARVFGGGAGADAVVALRWAQVPLWVAALLAMARIGSRDTAWLSLPGMEERTDRRPAFLIAAAVLLAAPAFVSSAVQYRVDVPGTCAFALALALVAFEQSAARWVAFGALMSLAVLANMRLAPSVIAAAFLMLLWREGRWRFNVRALWMVPGVAVVAILFLAYLQVTRSWGGFVDGVVRYNRASDALVPPEANTFWSRLAGPFLTFDLAAILFWVAAVTGLILIARTIRTPRPVHLCAVLAIVTLLVTAVTGVQYPYHFLITYVLLLPVVAVAAQYVPRRWSLLLVAVVMVVNVSRISFEAMRYQDRIMRLTDARTTPGDRVWDGCGYALRRDPAYRYWFLPAGVRLMAERRLIAPYDLQQFLADPPAAIVYNERIRHWLGAFPHLGAYVVRHYLPLERNLWIPGLTALVDSRSRYAGWLVPRSGRYEVHASVLLAKHPWITHPLRYASMHGSDLAIPLTRLPRVPVEVRVDGVAVAPGILDLKQGSRLELRYGGDAAAGVLVVPAGTKTVCAAPDGAFIF